MATQQALVHVVVGVLYRHDGAVLLSSRPDGKPYAGYWEFAGGKVEAGESELAALQREFQEELGITLVRATRWLTKIHDYEHARVQLCFYRVGADDWQGMPQSREGQNWCWQPPGNYTVSPILPANTPILAALAIPELLSGSLSAGLCATDCDFRVQPWRMAERLCSAVLVPFTELQLARQHYPMEQIWVVSNQPEHWPLLQDVAAVVWPLQHEQDGQALLQRLHEGVSLPVLPMADATLLHRQQAIWRAAGVHGVIVDDATQTA